ncbi:MAG: DNA-processing protein DprA [Candidatus Faecousia sp.]|nr:DNA-processing protein DprA [Candidatus Faecousia sp.]
MNPKERGFLLLSGKLGDSNRKPLTTAQLRLLAQRASLLPKPEDDSQLDGSHLQSIGIDQRMSTQVLNLLEDERQLDAYLSLAERFGCSAVTRASEQYPQLLRKRLGNDAPGCLWLRGDGDILRLPAIALVGSRNLATENRAFAREVGIQAARQGYVLVSGNARGADSVAQAACLEAGGQVISIVADSLLEHSPHDRILYVSEEGFDEPFSTFRALHRNHLIHCLGAVTFVAQCTLEKGGTWQGTAQNLRKRWSPVFCLGDGSDGALALQKMGATLIDCQELRDFSLLSDFQLSLF